MSYQPLGTCVIVLNSSGQNVLLGKRKNSFGEGLFGMPGGRIELGEEAKQTAIRETKEETDLDVKHIDFVCSIREFQGEYDFVHFAFVVTEFKGEIKTCEPDKCEGWDWYLINKLPKNIINGHKIAIESYLNGSKFVDIYKK